MDILSQIQSQLDGSALDGLARRIGAGRGETERAVGAALPMIVGGLARNAARSPDEAASLARALDEDHDPSLLDQLGGMLGGGGGGGLADALGGLLGGGSGGAGRGGGLADLAGSLLGGGGASRSKALDGAGILRHVFGDRRGAVEGGVGRASGLDAGKTAQLLMFLAPMVMSALAKVKQQRRLDERGLTEALRRERREIEAGAPGVSRGALTQILDRDRDGDVGDDIASLGASLAKAFFSR